MPALAHHDAGRRGNLTVSGATLGSSGDATGVRLRSAAFQRKVSIAHFCRVAEPDAGGVRMALIHRGGLRADILSEGVIDAGDTVRVKPS